MSANNITQLCQKAAQAFLQADTPVLSFITDVTSQIVTGISSGGLVLPMVICQCASATAAVPYEGNWSATLRIELRTEADDYTADQHHANAGELFGKFFDSIAKERTFMSSQTIGFTAQQGLPLRQGWEVQENSWVSFLELQVECCGSYFSVA